MDITFQTIYKMVYTETPSIVYKKFLETTHIKYIYTKFNKNCDIVDFFYRSYQKPTIIEQNIEYNTLTNDPDNVYDEVTDKMSNIYELMTKDYV
ncbi:hypothetical protein AGMMS49579_01440 [Spirochaetia bacterium]|nr:hypothetical protein AGMMS49579_01440 [Spirochaetia bacterium]